MRRKRQLTACLISAALMLGAIPTAQASAAKTVSLSVKKLTVAKGKSKTLKVRNAKKKVSWKILSGKKYIALKKKGKVAVTIKGRKKGTARIQATVGKKKLTCKVTVRLAKPAVTAAPTASAKPSASKGPLPTESTVPKGTEPTNAPEEADQRDVAALKGLIAEQRKCGATVSLDMSAEEYIWRMGRLEQILWNFKELQGKIDFAGLTGLKSVSCRNNQLTDLDVSKNALLVKLDCNSNRLASLDVSKNAALESLSCEDNRLTSLDVTKNAALAGLRCAENQLASLDVSKNADLKDLSCEDNRLTSLDVSKNAALMSLACRNNLLTSLDVTDNQSLTYLSCGWYDYEAVGAPQNPLPNYLTSLDVSNNPDLQILVCDKVQLTDLDLSKNLALKYLSCRFNRLTSLDVSKNVSLGLLWVHGNQLTSLDLTNNAFLWAFGCDSDVQVEGRNRPLE